MQEREGERKTYPQAHFSFQ